MVPFLPEGFIWEWPRILSWPQCTRALQTKGRGGEALARAQEKLPLPPFLWTRAHSSGFHEVRSKVTCGSTSGCRRGRHCTSPSSQPPPYKPAFTPAVTGLARLMGHCLWRSCPSQTICCFLNILRTFLFAGLCSTSFIFSLS